MNSKIGTFAKKPRKACISQISQVLHHYFFSVGLGLEFQRGMILAHSWNCLKQVFNISRITRLWHFITPELRSYKISLILFILIHSYKNLQFHSSVKRSCLSTVKTKGFPNFLVYLDTEMISHTLWIAFFLGVSNGYGLLSDKYFCNFDITIITKNKYLNIYSQFYVMLYAFK